MAYTVKTEAYQGPFDLLLYLVSKKRVDIGAISINEIADQYLEEVAHMQMVDLDVASDFLLVASTLLEIKAQSLIPRDQDELDEEIAELSPDDAREMLVGRLITYKQFKNASEELYSRYIDEGHVHTRPFGPPSEFLGLMPDFLKDVTVDSLGMLAAAAMARREIFLLESEHIAAKPIPVEVHVRAIHARVRSRKKMTFSDLLAGDARPELIVVTFLAILELYKRQMIRLEQTSNFGEISLSYIEGSGELTFDDEPVDDGLDGDASGDSASGSRTGGASSDLASDGTER